MELAPVCGNTSFTLLGGLLTTFCSMSVDICAHLAKITFVRSGTENGRENLVVSWVYWTSHSKRIGINMELLPIVAISTSTLLGRNILEWIFECLCPFNHKNLCEVRYRWWMGKPGWLFKFIEHPIPKRWASKWSWPPIVTVRTFALLWGFSTRFCVYLGEFVPI